eukprot:scaffold53690_cov58-Phaeocystis_antarctica.AAC.2
MVTRLHVVQDEAVPMVDQWDMVLHDVAHVLHDVGNVAHDVANVLQAVNKATRETSEAMGQAWPMMLMMRGSRRGSGRGSGRGSRRGSGRGSRRGSGRGSRCSSRRSSRRMAKQMQAMSWQVQVHVMAMLDGLVLVVEDEHAARVDGAAPGSRDGGRDRDQVLPLVDVVVHELDRVLRQRVVRRDDCVFVRRAVVRVYGHDLAALHALGLELLDDTLGTPVPVWVAVLHKLQAANCCAKLVGLVLLRHRRLSNGGRPLQLRLLADDVFTCRVCQLLLLVGCDEIGIISGVEEGIPDHWVDNPHADAKPQGLRLGRIPRRLGELLLLPRRRQPLVGVLVAEVVVVVQVGGDVSEVAMGRQVRLVTEKLGLVCDVMLDLAQLVHHALPAMLCNASKVGVLVVLEPLEAARKADADADKRGEHADHQIVLRREPLLLPGTNKSPGAPGMGGGGDGFGGGGGVSGGCDGEGYSTLRRTRGTPVQVSYIALRGVVRGAVRGRDCNRRPSATPSSTSTESAPSASVVTTPPCVVPLALSRCKPSTTDAEHDRNSRMYDRHKPSTRAWKPAPVPATPEGPPPEEEDLEPGAPGGGEGEIAPSNGITGEGGGDGDAGGGSGCGGIGGSGGGDGGGDGGDGGGGDGGEGDGGGGDGGDGGGEGEGDGGGGDGGDGGGGEEQIGMRFDSPASKKFCPALPQVVSSSVMWTVGPTYVSSTARSRCSVVMATGSVGLSASEPPSVAQKRLGAILVHRVRGRLREVLGIDTLPATSPFVQVDDVQLVRCAEVHGQPGARVDKVEPQPHAVLTRPRGG